MTSIFIYAIRSGSECPRVANVVFGWQWLLLCVLGALRGLFPELIKKTAEGCFADNTLHHYLQVRKVDKSS